MSLPSTKEQRDALVFETDIYGLETLCNQIQCPRITLVDFVSEEVAKHWQAKAELRHYYSQGAGGCLAKHQGMHSLFDTVTLHLVYQPHKPMPCEVSVMHDGMKMVLKAGYPVLVNTLHQFATNFNIKHHLLLNCLPQVLQDEPIIVAGGSVLIALMSHKLGDPTRKQAENEVTMRQSDTAILMIWLQLGS